MTSSLQAVLVSLTLAKIGKAPIMGQLRNPHPGEILKEEFLRHNLGGTLCESKRNPVIASARCVLFFCETNPISLGEAGAWSQLGAAGIEFIACHHILDALGRPALGCFSSFSGTNSSTPILVVNFLIYTSHGTAGY
jgi:hypothetical protein